MMNEQLQQALAEILSRSISGVEAGSNFLAAEIPEVIQQLLTYKLISSLAWVLFWALLSFGCVAIIRNISRGVKKKEGIWSDCRTDISLLGLICSGMSTMLFIASVCSAAHYAEQAFQIWLAPKIYLIEYAASLAK